MVICGNEGVVEIEYNCGMNTPWCVEKPIRRYEKCYVRKESAMCEKKMLCAKRKCYVRNEIDEPAVKGVHLNLYNGEIELAGKTQYHLLVSKLGKKMEFG